MSRLVAAILVSFCVVASPVTSRAQLNNPCPPAALQVYQNLGIATNAQVDATTFINWGEFLVSTLEIPWEAQNVRFWENRGVMGGSLGFRFNNTTCNGKRLLSDRFENTRAGVIRGFDGGGILPFFGSEGIGLFTSDTSYALINAREVINRGDIGVGPSGLIQLTGETVDLTGGTLIVEPIGGTNDTFFGGFFLTSSNFFPDAGLYDLAWGVDTTTNLNPGIFVQGLNPAQIATPFFSITNVNIACGTALFLTNAATWVLIRDTGPTNFNIQVVAVQTSDTNIFTDVRWVPMTLPGFDPPSGGFLSAVLEFTSPATNIITLQQFTNRLYLFDQLASHTNYGLSVNLAAGTLRPSPFVLSRFSPFLFTTGVGSNDVLTLDLLDNGAYSNQVATNIYAAYAANVDYVVSRLPQIPDVGYTNRPGRVEIKADDLTMTAARIRGEGLVSITGTNFIDSTSSIIDAPSLDFALGVEGQTLRVQDLAREEVQRFSGNIAAYSTIWTNTVGDPFDTNVWYDLRFHILVVDARGMKTKERVLTHDLELRAPPGGVVEIEDNLTVTDRLLIDSQNLVINGRLALERGLTWSPANLVALRNLTNNGVLQLTEVAEFQALGGGPLDNFVNRGTVHSFSHFINTDYFENTGSIVSTQNFTFRSTNFCLGTVTEFTNFAPSIGPISVTANAAKLDGGEFRTAGDIRLQGGVYKINNHDALAGGAVFFEIDDTLTDNGPQSGNLFQVADGFHMTSRALGDLLGTEIQSFAGRFGIVDHSWASEDRGATAAGFSNNVALGHLVISGDLFSQFRFLPGVPGGALYVDLLEIDGEQAVSLRNFTNTVRLLGMNVYYGDVVSTNANLNAETLDGLQLGQGRIIWVRDYAGPRSGVDVALGPEGPTDRMNRALRMSANIDSDGDGIPNRFDDFPLTESLDLHLVDPQLLTGGASFQFSFASRPNARYVIEYTLDLGFQNWLPLGQPLDSGVQGGILKFTDQVPKGSPQRYYRARLLDQ